ncbi:MAG: SsrA-binding protein SmpB [Sphingobacteriaceae bacterium]|jgi:SsrA-binding protein
MTAGVLIKNKQANFEYFIIEKYEAGIQLMGTEIKSIRAGKANITDGYCSFIGNELFLINIHISEYSFGSFYNHTPKRDRKLLLNKKELKKIQGKLKDVGMTIIPLAIVINERGFAKVEIGLAKGKKLHDKRDSLKEKDAKIEMDRRLK